MKIEELLKIVDSGVVEEITIYYSGGRIKIEPNNTPIETKDERGAAESVNTETAEKAADTLRKYCKGFNVCSESCGFYNKNDFGCCVNFPVDYVKKDGGKA